MPQTTRIALLQHACTDDVAANIAKAHQMMRDAAKDGAKLVLTQELYTSLYFCQIEDPALFDLAVSIPGALTDELCDIAKSSKINMVASLFERRDAGLYHNTSVCIDDTGTLVNRYRKMHIPDDPGFYEKFYFTPGDAEADAGDEEGADRLALRRVQHVGEHRDRPLARVLAECDIPAHWISAIWARIRAERNRPRVALGAPPPAAGGPAPPSPSPPPRPASRRRR